MAAMAAMSATAANITENFGLDMGLPTTRPTEATEYTSTNTNLTYTVLGCYVAKNTNVDPNYEYLMVNGKNQSGAYIAVELPIDCQEINITSSTGASTNTASKLSVLAGETEIGTYQAVPGSTFKVTIPAALRDAGTVYTIKSATTKYNQQITTIEYVEVTSEPSISANVETLSFGAPLNGKQAKTVKFAVENATGNITLGCDNDAFTVPASVAIATAAEGIEVEFTAAAAGNKTATLTATVGSISTTVALNAVAVANEGTEENPLTVADVIALNNLNVGPYYVTGTIHAGAAQNAKDGVLQVAEDAVATNLVLEGENNELIAVALPSGDTRTTLNLVDNPTNVGKKIIISGTLENYFGCPGVKNTVYVGEAGVGNITIDANEAVEYFNLQGVRVANPENGLYIVRQGNKASKVVL